ncbi:AAA family ATPase [Streptomyces albofaciens JCM 4342]|uniref:DnaB-like helicase N-terminal domain-containing protein n=1 Tax=Streptomyces albofaciens TaxID=66866 RepID=UPI00123AD477|nr:DnaB-like helicase N-terminal domain-containing protein [Streptomyces albofaciens]KAA6221752.1 AAA family ATPase [Streptomyces albofaciens JCM 4342]
MDTVRHIPRPTADDRTPPHALEAEEYVTGVIMHSAEAYNDCAEIITRDDLYTQAHRLIWDVVGGLVAEGKTPHPVHVKAEIERLGRLREVGGGHIIDRLGVNTITAPMAPSFAEEIREAARLRRIDEFAIRLRSGVIERADPDTLEQQIVGYLQQQRATTSDPLGERFRPGGSFILDRPDTVPALWGDGEQVIWAESEALLIAGPAGVGKTTLAQQVILAAIGVHHGRVLGLPVRRFKRVLYLASDRPQQAARSMARMVTPEDRDALDEHLVFWPGPPPADFIKDPGILLRLCQAAGADAVCLDSLKDMAGELASEEGGQAINTAIQRTLVEGIEVIGLHHHRKQSGGKDSGKEPTSLDELYGSTWITAGAGSVISLHGAAGEPIVSLRHLKQPAAECGPWKLKHDHPRGRTEVWHQVDVLGMLRAAGSAGVTPAALAVNLYPNPKSKPTTSEIEKARRRLDQYVEQGLAVMRKTGKSRTAPVAYFAAFNEQGELPDADE